MAGIEKNSKSANLTIRGLVGAMAGVAGAIGIFRSLGNAVDGAVSRYDTLNQFPRVLEQIGFSSAESERAINDLTSGIEGLPTRLDDVAGTAQRIAVMTKDLDGAVSTTIALNNAFLASGSSAEDASRGLEQYIQMLSRGEVDLESFRSLQETMGVALNDIAESFGYTGASAQTDLYEALKEGEVTFDEFNARLIELSEEQGGFAERALTGSEGIRTAWANVQTAVVNGVARMIGAIDDFLAQTPLESIQNIFEMMKDTINSTFTEIERLAPIAGEAVLGIYNALADMYGIIKPMMPVIVGIVGAIAGFSVALSVINSVKNAFVGIKASMIALWAVISANPIAILVGAIVGLIASLVYLWNTNEEFRDKLIGIWEAIRERLSGIMEYFEPLLENFRASFARLQESVGPILENLKSAFEGLMPTLIIVAQIIGVALVGAFGIMMAGLNAVVQAIGPFLEGVSALLSFITNLVSAVFLLFTGQWSEAWEYWKQAGQDAMEVFVRAFETVVQFIDGFVTAIIDFFYGLYQTLVGGSIIPDMVNEIVDWFNSLVDSVVEFVSGLVDSVVSFFTNLYDRATEIWQNVKDTISQIVEDIQAKVKEIFESLQGIVSGAFEKVVTAVSDGMTNAYEIVTGWVSDFFDAGRNLVENIADGIRDGISFVTDAVDWVTGIAREYWPFSPAKRGPLRDIHKHNLVGEIARGILDDENVAVRAMRSVADSVGGAMPTGDIASRINALHRRSNSRMQMDYINEMEVARQPAYINLTLGRRDYQLFVEDISSEQGRLDNVRDSFR